MTTPGQRARGEIAAQLQREHNVDYAAGQSLSRWRETNGAGFVERGCSAVAETEIAAHNMIIGLAVLIHFPTLHGGTSWTSSY